jgi:hypothetical protein
VVGDSCTNESKNENAHKNDTSMSCIEKVDEFTLFGKGNTRSEKKKNNNNNNNNNNNTTVKSLAKLADQ